MYRTTKTKTNQLKKKKQITTGAKPVEQIRIPKNAPKTVITIGMNSNKNIPVFKDKKRKRDMNVPYKTNFSKISKEGTSKLGYIESVLNPFSTKALRAPNDFYQATSLMDYRFEYDWTPGTNNG